MDHARRQFIRGKCGERQERSSFILGSLSKDDGNGKDNARKQWSDWLNEENNRAARAARTLAEFFGVVWQMTTWNFQI